MRTFIIHSLIIIHSLLLCNCSTTHIREDFDKYDGFWNWMIGRPRQYEDPMLEPVAGKIVDEKHPYYLGFMTPEIIFNPQGGIYYPDMIVQVYVKDDRGKLHSKFYNTADLANIKDESLRRKILDKRFSNFKKFNAGLVEFILPYREITSAINGDDAETPHYVQICGSPLLLIFAIPFRVVQPIIYLIHDVLKTLMLPVATVYYTVKVFDDNGEEEPEK
ncbi:MAG: hypothetical protein KDK90_27815 [Leptospiraceae bacterium]|nr:hypothetical protein [Leptospiraceae bacterium]